MMTGFGGFGMVGGIGMIVFWGAFIWLIVWLIRNNSRSNEKTPIQIAKERYARGEITKKQLDEIKKEI